MLAHVSADKPWRIRSVKDLLEESVKLTLVLSVPIWSAMAVFVIVAGIFGGVSGLGVAFAAVFFSTIFWFVAVTKIIGEPRDDRGYRGDSLEGRLAVIEDRLNQLVMAKKE